MQAATLVITKLVFRNGDRRGEAIDIESSRFRIGRHPKCHLHLQSDRVSRLHCAVMRQRDTVTIQDLGSRNGTYVNGQRLKKDQSQRLKHRDKIQIGGWKFRISLTDAATGKPIDSDVRPPKASHRSERAAGQPSASSDPPSSPGAPSSSIDDLLDDLDAMSSRLEAKQQQVRHVRLVASAFSSSPVRSTAANRPKPMADHGDDEAKAAETDTAETDTEVRSETERETRGDEAQTQKKKTPGKLPEHLRPQGPVDSKDAANEALRRIFEN